MKPNPVQENLRLIQVLADSPDEANAIRYYKALGYRYDSRNPITDYYKPNFVQLEFRKDE